MDAPGRTVAVAPSLDGSFGETLTNRDWRPLTRFTGRRSGGDASGALRYHNVYGPRMPRDTPYADVASIFSVYSSGAMGRLVPEDVIGLVTCASTPADRSSAGRERVRVS